MIRNNLCPQDYCDMIIQYISNNRRFTKSKTVDYCIKNTKILDNGDYEKIIELVQKVLDSLCDAGFVSKCGENYKEVKNVKKFNGTIFDDVRPMRKFSKKEIVRLNEIDKNTNNLDCNI